jgi:hypothetical protein
VLAADSSDRQPVVADIALVDGGVLLGQVVDTAGTARPDVPVSVLAGDQELATAKTGGSGYFAFRGLRGGVYRLATAESHGVYRVWAPGTAPPSAGQGVLIVTGDDVARGTLPKPLGECAGWTKFWLSNPWVIGAIVATAITVPVVLHNAGGEEEPVSP